MRVPRSAALLACLCLCLATRSSAGPIDDLQPGYWYQVPNSRLAGVVPNPVPPGFPEAIITAWSGGAYDTRRDRLIVWGGGHGDYGGNEVYAFDINTLAWSRIWGPTPVSMIEAQMGQPCSDTYADGNPVSRHTYDGLEYLPNQDRFWIQGGSRFCGSGGSGQDTWTFDLAGGRWYRHQDTPAMNEAMSAYDPVSGHVFLAMPQYVLYEFSPSTGSYMELVSDGYVGSGRVGTIDPVRRKFVAVGSASEGSLGDAMTYDIAPPYTESHFGTTGATEILTHRYPGLVYDPTIDRVVAWAGGANVYSLNLDTRVWTRHAPATGNTTVPTSPPPAGTYGRFRYIPSKNAYIVVSSINENVFFYKLSPGGGAPGDTTAPSPPVNLRPR